MSNCPDLSIVLVDTNVDFKDRFLCPAIVLTLFRYRFFNQPILFGLKGTVSQLDWAFDDING